MSPKSFKPEFPRYSCPQDLAEFVLDPFGSHNRMWRRLFQESIDWEDLGTTWEPLWITCFPHKKSEKRTHENTPWHTWLFGIQLRMSASDFQRRLEEVARKRGKRRLGWSLLGSLGETWSWVLIFHPKKARSHSRSINNVAIMWALMCLYNFICS